MKKVNVSFLRILVFPFVLLFSLLCFVMLAGVAPANAKTFLVSLYGQGVHAWEWPDGASVEVIIYEDETKASELCSDEQTVNSDGTVNFDLSGCQDFFQPGNYVEMTDGTDTKTHVVAGVELTKVDIANNIVKGTLDTALTDRRVALQVVTTAHPWTTIYNEMYAAEADPTTGEWEIDLTGKLDDPPGTLTAGMYVEAMWHDADHQSTRYGWGPTMNVSWEGDFVHTWSWPPEVDVTLEVYDAPGGVLQCTANGPSLPDGQGFDLIGCDIQPGNLVKLFESSPIFYIGAVSHIVTNLTVDCAGDVDGYVTGTAVPGSGVSVQTWAGMQHVITDEAGNWAAGPFENEFPGEGVLVTNLDWLDNGTQIDREFGNTACLSLVDIKPGGYPNCINPGSKGVLPVAILASPDNDVSNIDPDTISIGIDGVSVSPKKSSLNKDVNGDGLPDLVSLFPTKALKEASLLFDGATLVVTAETYAGQSFSGEDGINLAGGPYCSD